MKVDHDIRTRLGRLPPKLEQLYREIYDRLVENPGETGQSIIRSVLKWLLCARRQMRNAEFRTAVARNLSILPEELGKAQVLDLCQNFVIYDEGLDVFRFAHLSVREFLEKQPDYDQSSCHALAAEVCLFQLMESPRHVAARKFLYKECAIDLKAKPFSVSVALFDAFYTYAVLFCLDHCRMAGEKARRTRTHLNMVFCFFLFDESESDSPLFSWARDYCCYSMATVRDRFFQHLLRSTSSSSKNLLRTFYIASAYGFQEILEECLQSPTLILQRGRWGFLWPPQATKGQSSI